MGVPTDVHLYTPGSFDWDGQRRIPLRDVTAEGARDWLHAAAVDRCATTGEPAATALRSVHESMPKHLRVADRELAYIVRNVGRFAGWLHRHPAKLQQALQMRREAEAEPAQGDLFQHGQ